MDGEAIERRIEVGGSPAGKSMLESDEARRRVRPPKLLLLRLLPLVASLCPADLNRGGLPPEADSEDDEDS